MSVLDGEAVLLNLQLVESIIEGQGSTDCYDSFVVFCSWEIDLAIIKQAIVSFINNNKRTCAYSIKGLLQSNYAFDTN